MSELSDIVEVTCSGGKDVHYLYKIENKLNGKIYIGVTKNLRHRMNCHLKYPNYKDEVRLVNLAVEKYGRESFDFSVLCIGAKDYIYDLEIKAIKSFNSNATTGYGYNLSLGGEGGKGPRGPVKKRVDDKPTFVSGWWFPNKRTALKILNWKEGLYSSRSRKGILGEICFIQQKHGPQSPVFVSGFWFPSKKQALISLNWATPKYDSRKRYGILGDLTIKKNHKR